MSMSCFFFNRAQTICCLKLAIAFDAQESEYGISHILNGASPRLAQCRNLRSDRLFYKMRKKLIAKFAWVSSVEVCVDLRLLK